MSKFSDPMPRSEHECPKCHQVLQPLSNGIPHHCKAKSNELTYDEMFKALEDLQDHYGETRAEHLNETAMFGDSWPGAQIELGRMLQGIRELEQEIKNHPDHEPPRNDLDESLSADDVNDDDIPF